MYYNNYYSSLDIEKKVGGGFRSFIQCSMMCYQSYIVRAILSELYFYIILDQKTKIILDQNYVEA